MTSSPTPKILLVDDQPINLQAASAVLSPEEFKILVARDGKRAITIAQTQKPDLILLDVMMPQMDGYVTCKRLKEDPETAEIPVIFLTAKAGEGDIAHGFDVGGVDYVTKPFRNKELLARVRTHIELRRANQHLRRLNDLKSEFLGMAAHDLKNPLQSISGFTSLLLIQLEAGKTLSADEGDTLHMLKRIEETAIHMTNLIHELLEGEALHAGNVELHPEVCDLNGVILDVLEMNRRQAESKEIALHYEPITDCRAIIDRRSIRECFDNIVNNAVKYSPRGSSVQVRLEPNVPESGKIRFSVKDEGPGLSEEDLAKVFGKFQKLSARPTGGETSTGLGLSIVKALVEQLGGEVFAESEGPGKGATFAIDLDWREESASAASS